MEPEGSVAFPVTGYRLLKNARQPTVAIFVLETGSQPFHFAASREVLEDLADALHRLAETMPRQQS